MKSLLIAIIFSLSFSASALASELLMVHHPLCPFCKAFMNDVALDYSTTKQGKALPLVILDITITKNMEWLEQEMRSGNIYRILGTPTFIIYNYGKEIGRVEGYSGKEWFYEELDKAVRESVYGKG